MGAALSRLLVADGWEVHGTTRQPDRRDAAWPEGVTWHALDLARPEAVKAWLDSEAPLLRRIDVFVNNAGAGLIGPLEALPSDAVAGQLSLLLGAPTQLCQAVLPTMKARRAGMIVNISSLAAELPLPYAAPYNAAKAGLAALSTSLRQELRGSGVAVLDYRPGDLKTAFNQRAQTHLADDPRAIRAWEGMEKHLAAAPSVEGCAQDLFARIQRRQAGRARWGDWFQTRLAPWGVRLLPPAVLAWAIRQYYRLDR